MSTKGYYHLNLTFVLFILHSLQQTTQAQGLLCTQVFNFDALYTLNLLQSDTYLSYDLPKNQGTFNTTIEKVTDLVIDPYVPLSLKFNFCSPVKFKATEACAEIANADPSFAMTLDGSCNKQLLATSSKFENYEMKLIDADQPKNGIIYTLNRTDTNILTGKSFNSSIAFIIYCDSANTANTFTPQAWRYYKNDTHLQYYVQASSNYGCAVLQISKIWSILEDNKIIFTIVMICLGALLCFFGLKLYKPTMFVVGYLTGFGVIVVIMGEFVIRYDSESAMAYASLIIAIVFGVLVGYVVIQLPKIGFFALGMWLGIVLALLLNNAVLYKIQISNSFIVLWITIGVLAISMGLLSCFFYRNCVIICTGFVGSYMLIRPFGWIIGDFPNELAIAKEMKYGTLTSVPSLFYLYMALIVLIGLIGIRFQWGMQVLRRKQEEEKDMELFLADPEFMELNKSLLDKDEEDLTEKEKGIKKKLERMQKNIEKEQKKQEKRRNKIMQLQKKGKNAENKDEDDNSDSDDQDNQNSDDSEEEGNQKKKIATPKGNKQKNNNMTKSKKQTKQQDSSNDEDEEESIGRNQSNKPKNKAKTPTSNSRKNKQDESADFSKQFNSLFGGILKNKQKQEDNSEDNEGTKKGIEMDDLSEENNKNSSSRNQKVAKKNNKKLSNSSSEEEQPKPKKNKKK